MKTVFWRIVSVLIILVAMSGVSFAQVFYTQDFGSGPYPGPALPSVQTSYAYNAPTQPANFPNILTDGEYVLATDSQQGFVNWASINDHTTGSGYMLLINADDNQSGEFYRDQVTVTANTAFDFFAYMVTVNSQGDYDYCSANEGGLVLPNVTMQIENSAGTVLASLDTGDIPFNPTPEWADYELTFTTDATTTSVDVVLINHSLGGCGNDLAIDDITFRISVTMDAFDDSITLTDTSTAQNNILALGANDTIDGNPLSGTEVYAVASGSNLPPGFSLNTSTGQVSVAAATAEGVYIFDYEVCAINGFNCSIATATITIAFPSLPITTTNDNGSVADSSVGFTSVLNVLDNDSIDGVSPPSNFDLSVASTSSVPAGLTFNVNTGAIGVLQGTSTGIYSFDYDLCEAGDPSNCETATVTINVTNLSGASVCPAGTASVEGTYHVVSATGGDVPSNTVGIPLAEGTTETGANSTTTYFGAITMDLTGDADILAPEGEVIEVVLSSAWGTTALAEILMSADGVSYTSLGTTGDGGSVYGAWSSNILRYDDFAVPMGGARYLQVLQISSGVRADGVIYNTQCQAVMITVLALDDSVTVETSASVQTNVINLIDNDSFDGVTPSSFDLSITSGSTLPPELTFDLSTGEVGVIAGAAEGVYSFEYDICEAGTSNCDTAIVTITVSAPATTTLSASKSVVIYDPNSEGRYALPNNDVIYTINIENTGTGNVGADSLVLIDDLPAELAFYNDDIDDAAGPESEPVIFVDGASGLSFTYNTDVAYSDAALKPTNFDACDYTPLPAYDMNVSYICFNPKGSMVAGSNWSVSFRARIN